MRKSTYILLVDRLDKIISLLEGIKQQEHDYWETWKLKKDKENK